MASNVDITVPTSPDAYTGPVRQNFATIADEITTLQNALAGLAGPYLPISGGILTGPLALASDPTTAMGAATKQYADRAIHDAIGAFLPLYGGTLTGPLTIEAGPDTTNLFVTGSFNVGQPDYSAGYVWLTSGGAESPGQPGISISRIPGEFNTYLAFCIGSLPRWLFQIGGANSDDETGGNAGSDLHLFRYDDGGNLLGTPIDISRATGAITLDGLITTINAPQNQDAPWTGMAPALMLRSDASQFGPALILGPGTSSTPDVALALLRYTDNFYISLMPLPGDTSGTVAEIDLFAVGQNQISVMTDFNVSGRALFFGDAEISGLLTIGRLATDATGNIDLNTPDSTDATTSAETYLWTGGSNYGNSGPAGIGTGDVSLDGATSGFVEIWTGNSDSGNSGQFALSTGTAQGVGNQSGDIQFKTGNSNDGIAARGRIILDAANVKITGRALCTADNGDFLMGTPNISDATNASGQTYMWSGDNSGAGPTGWAGLGSGNTNSGDSGGAEVWTGVSTSGQSGPINIYTGGANANTSGLISLITGRANGAGNQSGDIVLQTGASVDGIAIRGSITLDAPTINLTGALEIETTADPQIVGTVLDIAATGVGADGWAYLYTINQPAGDTGQAGLGSGDAAAGNTGSIYLYSGNSAVGTSGGMTIATGNASGAGNTSGGMILQTGTVANGATRGTITLDAPVISLKGTLVTADASGAGNASGDIILQPGAVSGGATQGRVFLNGPTYIALPTADPHVPYMLWCDPTAGNVLKMSAG